MAAREPISKRRRSGAEMSRPSSASQEPVPIHQSVGRITAAETEAAALRAEVAELTDRGDRLRARLVASEREAVLLSEHLTDKGALVGELRADASLLRREFEASSVQRSELSDQLSSVRAQLDGRLAVLDATRAELARAQADLGTTQATADDLRARLEGAELDQQRAQERLRAAQQKATDLATELAASVATATAVSLQRDEARQELDRLRVGRPDARAGGADEPRNADLESHLAAAELGQLDQLKADERQRQELLADTEQSRDRYAYHLKATAPTALGRLAYRWQQYAEHHPGRARVIRAPLEGLWKVLTLRWPGWLRQHPLFDKAYYLEANRDAASGRLRPWWHYVRHGAGEGRAPNRYFDRAWYLRTYPDVAVAGGDPLEHYYRRGCWEGRNPSTRFATDWYLAQHPEVAAAGICPLLHFMQLGAQAGYEPAPPGTSGWLPAARTARPASRPALPATADPRTALPTSAAAAAPAAPMAAVSPVRADVRAIRKLVAAKLPAGARLGIVSDGEDDLLALDGAAITPVPRGSDGQRATDVPRNDLSAIAHVESLRAEHIDFLLAPQPSLWLTAVPGLKAYLDGRYARLDQRGAAALWDVRRPQAGQPQGPATSPSAVLGGLRDRLGREPSILDWGSGLEVGRIVPAATVFSPTDENSDGLPYADSSVDAVVLGTSSHGLDEARRVARILVIVAPDGADEGRIEWLDDSSDGHTGSVSIIVPTYDDVIMVASCLRTLDETVPGRIEAEFIVADDGSSDAIVSELEAVVASHPRARLVRNQPNGGYIAAVTAGAADARNDILVFLNNDTVLLPGWLEPLLETLGGRPEVGVVGGMLLYPDGRLQEAGCSIFRDGSATKIGYGDSDPTLPYYAHPRSVDYVSGALMATPRALFDELGGLDRDYGFGYYEDGDYCFKARRAGRDVVYQPASRVVHVEGGTAGLDLGQGPKQYQARNQALFMERWRDELERLPARPEPLDLHASRDLVIRGRVQQPRG